jgi:ubiquinone/menaquinone biosynthesis C-methylase UbiE
MSVWMLYTAYTTALLLMATAMFFFTVTRGALIMRGVRNMLHHDEAHVYPIYSNMRLIRLVDYQPIIAAILLFQYDRLVSAITHGMRHMHLQGHKVLITSCAFGNVMPRVVKAAFHQKADRVLVADIIQNELYHAQSKLTPYNDRIDYLRDNAVAMQQPDASVAANVMFFLLHELPHHLKEQALREAVRVLEPGGKLYLAEFHKPEPWVLRALSWTYFKVFEPLGLALWDSHDPLMQLQAMGGLTCERRTVFFGNFQIIVATKHGAPAI